jgi:hypothetical protein
MTAYDSCFVLTAKCKLHGFCFLFQLSLTTGREQQSFG